MLFAALSVFTDEDHEIRFGRVVLFVVVAAIALGALAWRLGFF
jgi:hypothetical protein